jgi:hypothetical protein
LSELYDNIFLFAVYDCCRNRKDLLKAKAKVISRGIYDQEVSDEVKSEKG